MIDSKGLEEKQMIWICHKYSLDLYFERPDNSILISIGIFNFWKPILNIAF